MGLTVGIPVAGEMGAGLGRVLADRGARVLTVTAGRSAATAARAREAGMEPVDIETLAGADIVLSVVPPGIALETAERIRPYLSRRKPLYIDGNAVSPATAVAVGETVSAGGAVFVDGGIIGGPPRAGGTGPTVYVSGPAAAEACALCAYGIDVRTLRNAIGAASALKMCYGGISKGLVALAASAILAARRAGIEEALHAELAESQSALLKRFARTVPAMYPKAYRWVAEMEEVSRFLDGHEGERTIYEGVARFYARLAEDVAGEGSEIAALDAFFAEPGET